MTRSSKSVNISFASPTAEWPDTAWHCTHFALPKKRSAPRFSVAVMAFLSPPCEPVDRGIRKHEREFEFGDGFAEHVEVDRCTRRHFWENFSKQLPVCGGGIQQR